MKEHDPKDATTLRWFIDNRWGDPASQRDAQELVDRIVGYPAASRNSTNGKAGDEGGGPPPHAPGEGGSGDLSPAPVAAGKVALVIGHNAQAKGAWADAPLSAFEYDFNSAVAGLAVSLAAERGIECRRFFRSPSGGYNAEIDRVYADVNDWKPALAVE
ncbi:MAG TPA: hypothetical protein PLA50_05225, partial [Bacteroidia bacterium]|nr:hypothetical protein [Bacteroidia bacterium]